MLDLLCSATQRAQLAYKNMHCDQDLVNQIFMQKKWARDWTGFRAKANHRGFVVGTALLVDASDAFIPGMALHIHSYAGKISADCLITFSIFQRIGPIQHRAYQLEICPPKKLSHRGKPAIHGPHEHTPDGKVRAVRESGVSCQDWGASLAWFLARTNIGVFDVEQPC